MSLGLRRANSLIGLEARRIIGGKSVQVADLPKRLINPLNLLCLMNILVPIEKPPLELTIVRQA